MTHWVRTAVRARYLVAALGEAAAPPWWRSQSTTPTGVRMLDRLFPRTALAASLATASDAACREHDRLIGRPGVYHLFRLPVADEVAVREWLRQPDEGMRVLGQLAALSPEERLAELAILAGREDAAGVQGPARCGAADRLHEPATLRRICAAYHAGFQEGHAVYPYVEEVAG